MNRIKLYSFTNKGNTQFKDKTELIEHLKSIDTDLYEFQYTYGLGYRNPLTNHEPITKEEAIKHIENHSLVDVDIESPQNPTSDKINIIHVNAFSCNDMW